MEYAADARTLLLHMVERAVRTDIQAWAQQYLFGPIGIEAGTWTGSATGPATPKGGRTSTCGPSDWARLGYLMLKEGQLERQHS